ncbi:hypothetical protein P9273_30620 [Mesorhizobium sp. WSM4935]|uniref:hypothetical protein n=1 Tax=Mesorhizobium sp. WSM4935 TaxID=3038547 RepID=UPI0024157607|nr:hypothetical protein [Mesorhizobium sp. WSM4935]MDG4879433.1 hypothetical protein [Mesorhizobium sp. WSM4935]
MAPTDVPDLHPNIATLYRKRVEQLTQALDDHEDGRPAAEALPSLIGEIVLTPGDKRGEVHAELRGELSGILEFAKPDQNQKPDAVMTKGLRVPSTKHKEPASRGLFVFAARAGDFNLHQGPATRQSHPRGTKSKSCLLSNSTRRSFAAMVARRPRAIHSAAALT